MRAFVYMVLLTSTVLVAQQRGPTSSGSAQTLSGIRAIVRYASGDRIPGAEVLLSPKGSSSDSTLRADASYGAAFTVKPGDYNVTATFRTRLQASVPVTVSPSEISSVRFVLVQDELPKCGQSSLQEMPAFFADTNNQTKDGSVSLTVYDNTGTAIPRAHAELLSSAPHQDTGQPAQLPLDQLGSASLKLPPGTYLLRVTAPHFHELNFKFTIGGRETVAIAAMLVVMPSDWCGTVAGELQH